jgi:hypothetical protein
MTILVMPLHVAIPCHLLVANWSATKSLIGDEGVRLQAIEVSLED